MYLIVQIARVIFWNAMPYGWSIGHTAWLVSGRHWHKSGLDSDEPWQGKWGKNVTVDCIKGAIKELEKSTMVNDLEDDNVLGNGALNIKQSFEVGYFPLIFLILYVKNVGAV